LCYFVIEARTWVGLERSHSQDLTYKLNAIASCSPVPRGEFGSAILSITGLR
jgi:hypothetical protein